MGGRQETIGRVNAATIEWLSARLYWRGIATALLALGCATVVCPQSGTPGTIRAASLPSVAGSGATARVRAVAEYTRQPLSFEANRGQADPRVKFFSRGPGYTLFLTQQEAVFAWPPLAGGKGRAGNASPALRLRFDNAESGVQLAGEDELPGKTNYFPSGNRSTWLTGIASYSQVDYRNLYPGVNAVFHGSPGRLEFDFDVAPGANPSSIALDVTEGSALRLDADGNIVLGVGKHARGGEITLGKPVVYQHISGIRREIPGRFILRGAHRIGFELGSYDRAQPLVIDPSISYSTYLGGYGGGNASYGQAIAVDSSGNIYVTGSTNSTSFPTPTGPGGTGQPLTFVSKFNASGSSLVYTSFLPQGFGAIAIAVDSNDSAYLGGVDPYYVATTGAYANGAGLTVIKMTDDGSGISYAAQLGPAFPPTGILFGLGIAVDTVGSAYIAASTNEASFPTTPGALQSSCWTSGCTAEATVSKLSPDGSKLVYSTLLGGHGGDYATGIAVDSDFNAYVTGATSSTDFPTTAGVLQPACSSSTGYTEPPPYCSDTDAFVSELNPAGTALVYSTYLGNGITLSNGEDQQIGIALDATGNAYVAGTTDSTVFGNGLSLGAGPTDLGPLVSCGSGYAICPNSISFQFLAKVAPGGGTLAYLGFLGGYNASPALGSVNGYTDGDSVAVDASGNAYLTGVTSSNYFPTTADAAQPSFLEQYPYVSGQLCGLSGGCGTEGFFSIINTGTAGNGSLVYSTYIGAAALDQNPTFGNGIAVDSSGNAWLTGVTMSSTFPTTTGALETSCTLASSPPAYCYDYAFVTKFTTGSIVSAADIAPVSGGGQTTTIGTAFANPLVVKVTDANGDPVSGANVTFIAPSSGASATLSPTTVATDSNGSANVTVTANGIAGSSAYQISATVTGVTTPATFSLTNTQAATTVTVTPSALSLVYGLPVTVNAAISPSSILTSIPSGSVAFYDGPTALTLDATVSSAAASYTVNVPTVGSHTYAAQYLGDTNFAGSALVSAASPVVVNKANVTLSGPATQPVTLQAGQSGSISVSIAGQYTGSGIASPTGGLSYTVSGNAFGPGSLLVANGTAMIPVPGTLPAGTYTITLSYAGDPNYNSNSIGIQLVVNPTLIISPVTLPAGTAGTIYTQTLSATGGSGTGYSWTVTSGTALSAVGLTLSPSGVISGNPTGTETAAAITIQVTDSLGELATQTYHLTIYPVLAITPTTLPAGIVGRSYTQTLTATGGSGSGYQWGVTSGTALSSVGLTLSSAGVISGTPTGSETAAAFTIDVADSLGDVTTIGYHLTISPELSITTATLPTGIVGNLYSQQLAASGGSGTGYTWSVTSGASSLTGLGLSLSAAGLVSGTPSTSGQASITVEVTDSLGDTATQSYLINIDPALSVAPATLPVGTVGVAYSQQLSASGGSGTGYTWSITADATGLTSLGLSLSSSGLISGTPTSAEQVDFTVQVTDSQGDSATHSYVLTVNNPVSTSVNINDPETITVNDSATQVQLIDVSDPETITVTDIAQVSVESATTVYLSGPAIAEYGQSVSITATVTPSSGSVTPAGTVTFTEGATTLATVTLNNSGSAILTTGALPVGSDTITATYNGSSAFLASNASDAVAVSQASTATVLTDSGPPSAGYNTTFTATVKPATSGTPTGTVTFYDDTVAMGTATLTAGIATFTTDTLAAGSDTITAVYSGDNNFLASTSNALTPQVSDFGITVRPPLTALLPPGQSTRFTLVVAPVNGAYDNPVSFSVSGLPSDVTATFNPTSVTPDNKSGTSILTMTAASQSARTGASPLPGRGGTALLALLVPMAAAFRRRRQLRVLLVIVFAAGTLGTLAAIGGCGFTQNPKAYVITVTASSGADQHTAAVTIIAQ